MSEFSTYGIPWDELAQQQQEAAETERTIMTAMTPCPEDHPLMIAWKAHQATEEFANSKKWAAYPEHLQGSLWALFMAGFNAAERRATAAESALAAAREELHNFVRAERFNRERFRDDTEFADWVQSRAQHTLAKIKAAP